MQILNGFSLCIASEYYAIPGENLQDKVSIAASRALKALPWIVGGMVLYPYVCKVINPNSPILALLIRVPYVGNAFLSLRFVGQSVQLQSAIQGLQKQASASHYFLSAAMIYVSFQVMVTIVNYLSPHANAQASQHPLPVDNRVMPSLSEIDSLVRTLDDYGLTIEDYMSLDRLFTPHHIPPHSLKQRVAGYLLAANLIQRQNNNETGPCLKREVILDNLRQLAPKPTVLPERHIETIQRVATAAFNLLLTGSTLALQMHYNFYLTLVGVVIGLALQDQSLAHRLKHALEESMLKSFDILLTSKVSKKTALTAPTTTAQKCAQVWQSWKLLLPSIIPFSYEAVLGGIAQGQILASYGKSCYEQIGLHFPRGN